MSDSSVTTPNRVSPGGIRLVIVFVGITLFVIGFLLTITSLSENGRSLGQNGSENSLEADGSPSHGLSGFMLIAGISTSLAGVVIATVGPLIPTANSGRHE